MNDPRQASSERVCLCGDACTVFEAGHNLHPILARAARATTSQWTDAIITSVGRDGAIELAGAFSSARFRVWAHLDLTSTLHEGDPVALHAHYGVLAFDSAWLSVRAIDGGHVL